MNIPWFAGTDESARQVLRAGQSDYQQFVEKTHGFVAARPSGVWRQAALAYFVDFFKAGDKKAQQKAAPDAYTSLQPR